MIRFPVDRSRRMRAYALAFILLVSSFQSAAGQQPAAKAPEAPPIKWPRSRDYDVQHYRISVSFDLEKKSVTGETAITLSPFKDGYKEVEIDAGEMTIHGVRLDKGGPLDFRYEGNEKLRVTLDKPYPAGAPITISISYSATPKKGLTFITPSETDPKRPFQIWSQGESETNHYWFPCYDYPNDKATSEMIATVEERFQVVSNGKLITVRPDPAKRTKTWHWKMDQPFSSYLISIIVGEYAEIKDQYKGIPVASYVYRDQVENGRVSFGALPRMVELFSEKLDFSYPYSKYTQTMVADFPGAMENITATTMTDTAVHDSRAALDFSSEGLVAHELAHSWFGNMLTLRDWSHLWLNEAFAVFFEGVWTEHSKGKDDYLYEMLGNQRAYYLAWSSGRRRPIVTMHYHDPDALFDTYVYPRGGAVVNMIRFVLGDEMFWKAMRHYVRENQWENVETQQLVVAIEEATGQNLQWFIDQWVYKMGHPEFDITSTYDEGAKLLKLVVKQTQKPDGTRPWFHSPEYFVTPVDIAITTASGEKTHRVWIDKAEKEFTLPADSKPLIVNFDRGNYLIKTVKFNRADEELAYQLLHDSDAMGRVTAAVELKSRRSEAAVKALREAALKDRFWGVRIEAVKSLGENKTDAARAALIEAVNDKESRVRRAALQGLSQLKDPNLADLYINVVRTDQSYFTIAEAAKALGQTGSPKAYDALAETLKQDSWQEVIRAGAMSGMVALKDARALDLALKYAARGNPASVRGPAFQLLAGVGKGNDRALELLTAPLKEPSPEIIFNALTALNSLGDRRAVPALEEFLKGPLPANLPEGQVKQIVNGVINHLNKAGR
jgi:aminopeptidase N